MAETHVIEDIRNKCPTSLIIAGGEHITALPEYSMNSAKGIDVCILGEGEETLNCFLEKYFQLKNIPLDIPGTFIRDKTGTIFKNSKRKRIRNLDEIIWPDWDEFPLENYFKNGFGMGVNYGKASIPILASRGCPYKCGFCSNAKMWDASWYARRPINVFNEMKYYLEKYNVTNFDFYDLTAIIKKSWIVEFCKLIIEKDLNINWQLPSGTRSEALDREVTKLLYKSGCKNLTFAPESGSPYMLRIINKKINLDKMLTSIRGAVAEGHSIKANIVCGFPHERRKHLFETLLFIFKLAWSGCDDMSIFQYSPYPGSDLFNDLKENNRIKMDDQYFISLSYYSSMANAQSYSEYLTNFDILAYKFIGTAFFYIVSFFFRPWKLVKTLINVFKGKETTRLEKALISYLSRLRGVLYKAFTNHKDK